MEENNSVVVCQICGKECKNLAGLAYHLPKHNITSKEYYDKYLKKDKNEHLCQNCFKVEIKFKNLVKGYGNNCFCSSCVSIKCKQTNIIRYGVDVPSKSDIIKNKVKLTNLEKYGVIHPSKLKETQDKKIKTNLEKYGVEHYNQTDEFKEKCIHTSLERYGVNHPSQTIENINKHKQTNYFKYGKYSYFQTEQFKEYNKNYNFKKYGVENYHQTEECKEKIKITCLQKYGVENPYQSEEIKEKIKQTLIDRYGTDNVNLICNNTFFSKISQDLFWNIYNKLSNELKESCYFAELNKEFWIRYNDNDLFFYDFCIKDLKLLIEFQGNYWHRNPKMYESTEENISIWKKDEYKKQIAEKNGFKVFYIWESDYKENKELEIQKCLDFINNN